MASDKQPAESTLPPVTLSGEQFRELIGAMTAAKAEGKSGPESDTALQALMLMAKTQETYAEEFKRQVRRSNQFHPNLSVYTFDPRCEHCKKRTKHPDLLDDDGVVLEARGLAHPKAALTHDTFFCFQRVRAEELTVVELELYNAFEKDVECRNGTWKATFKRNGSKRELHIFVPFQTVDEKAALPELTVILSELLYGNAIVDPVMALDQIRAMQRQIDQLLAERAPKPSDPVPA